MGADRPTKASSIGVRKSMQANKGRDTKPELAVRKVLHSQGFRYRVSARPLPELRRTADMVFSRARVAVFVDGCFWHGCPQHHTVAATNGAYWAEKVEKNRARDAQTDQALIDAGWLPIRIWEHEDAHAAAAKVADMIRSRTGDGARSASNAGDHPPR